MSIEELANPPFPKFLQFETGTVCNAKCLMCPHSKMKRKNQKATWATIGKVIRDGVPLVDAVCPFLMQEPLIEPRLIPILANIKQRNPQVKTILYSNMSILTDKQADMILTYNLLDELHISFYGPTEELYKKWQPPLNRKRTIKNIKKFYTMRKQKGKTTPIITVHVLGVPEIVKEIKWYNELAPYCDGVSLVQFDTFHGDIEDYGGDQTKYMGRAPSPRTPCQRLWSGINVHFDGSVVPCCIDYNDENVMGNIHAETLMDIWCGFRFQQFRRMHMQGRWNEIPMCKNCVVHEYQFNEGWVKYWLQKELTLTH